MPLDSKHPRYVDLIGDWSTMRDVYAGEGAVKAGGQDYLPATPGQLLDWEYQNRIGYHSYLAYKQRAVFPSDTGEAVRAMVGTMHGKPAVIELPPVLEPLRERATLNGESLPLLLRRINEAQLITGRIGLMLDLPSTPQAGQTIPYIATYDTEKVINWDDGKREMPTLQRLNLVVLDESEYERNADFEWEMVTKYRVLVLGGVLENEPMETYRQGLFYTETFNELDLIEPTIRGQMLDQIPFVFVNPKDLLPEPDSPPLLDLAGLCLAMYRGSADYEQTLHLQGQNTLVVKGGSDQVDYRIGAGSCLNIPVDGDAKFIGVSGEGLAEQRVAIENKSKRAAEMGGRLLDTTSRAKESGEALKVRVAAQTATLNEIAMAGAEGLQTILRLAAKWIGADENAVVVEPNLEFAEDTMTPSDFRDLMDAKAKGLPLSEASLHALLLKNEITAEEFDKEMAAVNMEREAKRTADAAILDRFDAGRI